MLSRRFFSLFLLVVVLVTATFARPVITRAAPSTSSAVVINWNQITLHTVWDVAKLSPTQGFVAVAYVQAAVYDAVDAIQGGYQPYMLNLTSNPGASIDAAVSTASYLVLNHYFPAQSDPLNPLSIDFAQRAADYATSLAAVPDGPAKDMGIAMGTEAADGIIALRQGDGYQANIGFVLPAPSPGVWQGPLVGGSLTWMSRFQPFMLLSQDQFRPGPPPDLTSDEWAVEFNEIKTMGRKDSTVRTQEQTDIARFWSSYPPYQENTVFQTLSSNLDAIQSARLFAMGNMVISDALVACWDAKYHYLFWRPFVAVPQADTDGNAQTVADPTWTPLLATPPHPEYPSAHGCTTAAFAETLAEFLGTNQINIDVPSTIPGLSSRHFDRVIDLTQEIINARVWGGIHYRESVVKGENVGRKVAQWTLNRYFLPTN